MPYPVQVKGYTFPLIHNGRLLGMSQVIRVPQMVIPSKFVTFSPPNMGMFNQVAVMGILYARYDGKEYYI
jgi:hypothetical protein